MFPNFLNTLSWWQWTTLAAILPAIVLLYFLKLKRRPLEVPSTFLWKKSTEDLHVNTIWQRLRRNLLLFLQLLLIVLAAGALLRPSWRGTDLVGHRFVFLIDNSASMSAADVKPNRLEEAKRQAGRLIEQMRSGDAAMVISFSDTARVEQSFTQNRQQLKLAVDAIRPTVRGTSLVEALKLATSFANPVAGPNSPAGDAAEAGEKTAKNPAAKNPPTTLYILSDGRFPPDDKKVKLGNLDPHYIAIGSPAAKNVGITAFGVSRNDAKPDRLQAFARLENFGRAPAGGSAKLFLDDRLVDAAEVSPPIPPGKLQSLSFDLSAVAAGSLRLELAVDDDFAVDNVAYAVVNPPERRRVLVVTPGDRPLRLALRTKEISALADVQFESPGFLNDAAKYGEPAASGAWQLIIYDRCRPKKSPACNAFYIAALPPDGNWASRPRVASPQIIDSDTAHPLMQWIDLGDVLTAEALPLQIPSGGRMLVDSDAGPLMALAARGNFEDVVLAFPITLEVTNWPIRASFPNFALNLVTYLAGSQNDAKENLLRPGMTAVFDSFQPLRIRTPSGQSFEAASRSGKVFCPDLKELGVYEATGGGKPARRAAVNLFNPAESNILPDAAIDAGGVTVEATKGYASARIDAWRYLAAIALAVLLLEWYIYVRRVF